MAIMFRARSKNVSSASFVVIAGTRFTSSVKAWPGSASEGKWVEMVMMRHKSMADKFPYSYLSLTGSFKQSAQATNVMSLELADFVLLTTPK